MGAKNGKHVTKSRQKTTSDVLNEDDEIDSSVPNELTSEKHIKSRGSKKMPFFRKQSDQCKKRLDHQQYLAQESPEPIFDISKCELQEVPSNVFALCRVLQKEVLLIHDNWLSTLSPAADLGRMTSLRVLDCHNNELKSLPDEIGMLTGLQVLNLENNKLTKLPSTLGNLTHLQTLNVKGNKIKELPPSICEMKSLRMLDIRNNHVLMLPRDLCKVRTLETLNLDAVEMSYPSIVAFQWNQSQNSLEVTPSPADEKISIEQTNTDDNCVCTSGTQAIMKFLCSECGLEYLPPSNFLLNILDTPKFDPSSPSSKSFVEEENLQKSIDGYNNMMDKKRLERIELERRFMEHQEEQAQLALMSQMNREQMLGIITAEESKFDKELDKLAHEKELGRLKLVEDLQAVEKGADNLIKTLLDMNAKARKTEQLLEEIEQERIKEDKLFEVNWEQIQNLRRRDVLNAMERSLQDAETFETLRQNFANEKEHSLHRALEDDEMMSSAQIQSVLASNDKNLTILLGDLAKQELLQKEAFEALQLQKDVRHKRITNQISLIQEELANLTVIEIEKRGQRTEDEMNRLAEKRIALIELLSQLMLEQDKRLSELRKRLEEMEQQKLDGQADYWLVQFQRLMDQKPQSLIDREKNLEICVIKILEKSNAHDYLPVFARHRISSETLMQMNEDDLKQMGVHELGIRKDILRNVEAYKNGTGKTVELDRPTEPEGATSIPQPTAPPIEEAEALRQTSVTARGLNSECSICLDNVSEIVFLNCGHVCTCMNCSKGVTQCPLCRADIIKRIKLIPTQIV